MGLLSGTVTLTDFRSGMRLTGQQGFFGVIMAPPTEDAGQQWTVTKVSDGVQLKNKASGNLLAARDLEFNSPIEATSSDATTPNSTWVEVPGPEDGVIVLQQNDPGWTVGISVMRIFPPMAALVPPNAPTATSWIVEPT